MTISVKRVQYVLCILLVALGLLGVTFDLLPVAGRFLIIGVILGTLKWTIEFRDTHQQGIIVRASACESGLTFRLKDWLAVLLVVATCAVGTGSAEAAPNEQHKSPARPITYAYDLLSVGDGGPDLEAIRLQTPRRQVLIGFRHQGRNSGYDAPQLLRETRNGEATNTPKAISEGSPSQFTRTEALSGRASGRQVTEMAESMKASGWNGPPIKVVEANGKLYVVDGHHRLAAATQAGIKVPYQVVEPSTVIGPGQWSSLDDIIRDAGSVGPNRIRTK